MDSNRVIALAVYRLVLVILPSLCISRRGTGIVGHAEGGTSHVTRLTGG